MRERLLGRGECCRTAASPKVVTMRDALVARCADSGMDRTDCEALLQLGNAMRVVLLIIRQISIARVRGASLMPILCLIAHKRRMCLPRDAKVELMRRLSPHGQSWR